MVSLIFVFHFHSFRYSMDVYTYQSRLVDELIPTGADFGHPIPLIWLIQLGNSVGVFQDLNDLNGNFQSPRIRSHDSNYLTYLDIEMWNSIEFIYSLHFLLLYNQVMDLTQSVLRLNLGIEWNLVFLCWLKHSSVNNATSVIIRIFFSLFVEISWCFRSFPASHVVHC